MVSALNLVFVVLQIIKVCLMVHFFKVHQPHFLAKLTEQPNSRLGLSLLKKVRRAHEREIR